MTKSMQCPGIFQEGSRNCVENSRPFSRCTDRESNLTLFVCGPSVLPLRLPASTLSAELQPEASQVTYCGI